MDWVLGNKHGMQEDNLYGGGHSVFIFCITALLETNKNAFPREKEREREREREKERERKERTQ
jgi:hypothetical protein